MEYIGLTWAAVTVAITYTALLFGGWWCMLNWMLKENKCLSHRLKNKLV